ncbi:MAG: translation elongation factor 4 [Gammaproteobacteria bacterium]
MRNIRNFSIIAHIDHGKTTLADMLIRRLGGLPEREMKAQVLDTMDLERERGITIKSQTASLRHNDYALNLIDTPGHVDFSYEVSRSLAACEGALLVVDASQGVQAQTIANCNVAAGLGLAIVPVLNKTDLPAADTAAARAQIESMVGITADDAVCVSAKTGAGVDELLAALVGRVPPPSGDVKAPLRALIFDSWFDKYQGVVILVRLMDGVLKTGDRVRFMANGEERECESIGIYTPKWQERKSLAAGEVGCIITGLKDLDIAQVGDTLTLARAPCAAALPGFRKAKPHVFASFFPVSPNDFPLLREAAEKLRLNDTALAFETESSPALGFGLRCGLLGMLHLEITRERLEREYHLDIIIAAPGVAYRAEKTNGEMTEVDHPSRMPEPSSLRRVLEPMVAVTIVTPAEYVGAAMQIAAESRAAHKRTDYAERSAVLHYEAPLAELISGFFGRLKSASRGFASMDYEFLEYRAADVVRVDILINGERIDALAMMSPRTLAAARGRDTAAKLRSLIPRQMFDIAVQAAVGGKIIARETVKALRKNVTAKCYGGDITRKRKLLEKQKAGKKRMKRFGRVDIPQEAFLAALRKDD